MLVIDADSSHDCPMSEEASDQVEPSPQERSANGPAAHDPGKLGTQRWVRQAVIGLVLIVAAVIIYKVAASFLPRWWAQRVADQAGGGMSRGIMWGLFYGFVFTFIPVLILFQARRKLFSWKAKLAVVIVALLLAAPNWLTLVVVAANSRAAHAGERIMDVDAPGFRWATLVGVIVGGALAIVFSTTSIMLSHRRKQVKELKEQVKQGRASRETDKPENDKRD